MRLTLMKALLSCVAVVLASAASARADLELSISENGGPATILHAASGGTITPSGVVAGVPDFNFSGFSATSTLGSTEGELHGTGSIESTGTGKNTLTILVSDTGFTNPPGPHYQMNSSSSYSSIMTSSTTGFVRSFQSFATAGQNIFGMSVPSPGFTYSPIGTGLGSGSHNEAATNFAASLGYTLTQEYVWTSNGAGDLLSPTGSTIAAVPEPSYLALFGTLALVGTVVEHRRRRAVTNGKGA